MEKLKNIQAGQLHIGAKLPNLELKTRPRQLLGSLWLAFALTASTISSYIFLTNWSSQLTWSWKLGPNKFIVTSRKLLQMAFNAMKPGPSFQL